LKTMNTVHRIALKLSGNRLGASFGGMPSLELTTVGRKSGQPRSVMLTSPLQEGETYIVVASRGGDDVHPAWLLNLEANPEVEVQVGVRRWPGTAIALRPGDPDYDRLFAICNRANRGQFAAYQKLTDRPLPVVVLSRRLP